MIYDFKCPSCGKKYDIEIKLADYDKLRDTFQCQECHVGLVRAMTPKLFKLKGYGWSGDGYGTTDIEMLNNRNDEEKFEAQMNKEQTGEDYCSRDFGEESDNSPVTLNE